MQKLNSSAITLLQIFDLVFTGSWVATTFVMSHMYCMYWELLIYPQLHHHLNKDGTHSQVDIVVPELLTIPAWNIIIVPVCLIWVCHFSCVGVVLWRLSGTWWRCKVVKYLLLIITEAHHYILLAGEFLLLSGQRTVCVCLCWFSLSLMLLTLVYQFSCHKIWCLTSHIYLLSVEICFRDVCHSLKHLLSCALILDTLLY